MLEIKNTDQALNETFQIKDNAWTWDSVEGISKRGQEKGIIEDFASRRTTSGIFKESGKMGFENLGTVQDAC